MPRKYMPHGIICILECKKDWPWIRGYSSVKNELLKYNMTKLKLILSILKNDIGNAIPSTSTKTILPFNGHESHHSSKR